MRRARCSVILFGIALSIAVTGTSAVWAQGGRAPGNSFGDDSNSSEDDPWDLAAMTERLTNSAKTMVGKGTDPAKAKALYAEAARIYREATEAAADQRRELFSEAADQFEAAAKRWPDSALEQDALFLAGEGYFFADHYPNANDSYERLLKKYPNSKHLDTVEARRFKIADYWLKLHDASPESFWSVNVTDDTRPWRDSFGNAIRIFDRIRIDDPTGRLADDATLAAGNAWFARGRFIEADNFYTDLRKTFPSSEHQFHAHMLGLKSKLQSYQGSDYSGVPLDEAEKLIKQIRRQFPNESAREREYLARAYAEVRFKQAEREWKMANYYDARKDYGAAKFYYSLLVREYDETPLAEKAQTRLAEIQGEPDEPDQPLEWLVDMFPAQDNVQPLIATQPNGDSTRR